MNRDALLERLFNESFDILVIGGGAVGAGIALDASLRGYKTALVESSDFSSGSSSKSTKLLHGGVRYLEYAFHHGDWKQLQFVRDSLKERAILMKIAPHLTRTVSIILPAFSHLKRLYYWGGLKMYDWLSGKKTLGSCKLLDTDEVNRELTTVVQTSLKGGVLYLDGQFDDARFNLALVQTAVSSGCIALNYVQFERFLKEKDLVFGGVVKEVFSGQEREIRAKIIVNATGCFSDNIRGLDKPTSQPLLAPSRGTHILLKKETLPINSGFLLPSHRDNRVIFGLPWHGEVLVGTTDTASVPEANPQPTEQEIEFLIDSLRPYFSNSISRKDVIASWTGIRPLYQQNSLQTTSQLSRDHYIERSQSGLYSIVGGKWTTYRLMAKDLLDTVIHDGALPVKKSCTTEAVPLIGATSIIDERDEAKTVPEDVVKHLRNAYGDRASIVLEYAEKDGFKRLHDSFPYLEAEVAYVKQHEFAHTPEDVLYRRLGLGFLDEKVTRELMERVKALLYTVN